MARWLLATGSTLVGAVLFVSAPAAQEKPAPQTYSAFFNGFDPEKAAKEYQGRDWAHQAAFKKVWVKPPDEMFHVLAFRGELTEEEVKKLAQAMASNLYDQVKGAGATPAAKPKEGLDERPLGLFKGMWGIMNVTGPNWFQLEGLQGYHFTYSQGKAMGAVDVFAAHDSPANPKRWLIVCAIHESGK